MNRFRFRLQSVLRVREVREEAKKREFGVSLRHLNHEEERLDALVRAGEAHDRFQEASAEGPVSVRTLIQNYFYARGLEQRQEAQKTHVEKARLDMDDKRVTLVEATKERKIMERLRDRQMERHEAALRQEEQALIDDVTAARIPRSEDAAS